MATDAKTAIEKLICSTFEYLVDFGRAAGITVKRMRELLPGVQLRALRGAGLSYFEIMAESDYTRASIRKLIGEKSYTHELSVIDKFISDWEQDDEFPSSMVLDGYYPSFTHLMDEHGGDFTPSAMLKILANRNAVEVDGGMVTLVSDKDANKDRRPEALGIAKYPIQATPALENFVLCWGRDRRFPETLRLSGQFPAFTDLVENYAPNIDSHDLLSLLELAGVITVQGEFVTLVSKRFTDYSDVGRVMAIHSSLAAMLSTLHHNFFAEGEKYMERRVWSSYVRKSSVSELRKRIREAGDDYCRRVMETIDEYEISSNDEKEECVKIVGTGVYWFQEDE